MRKRRLPRGIPLSAVARPVRGADGQPTNPPGSDYFVGGFKVARLYFHPTGTIDWETHFDDQGRLHGVERKEFDSGRTKYRARWVHGLQHGLQHQWDEGGTLLVSTPFVRGSGTDLWFDCGQLAEQREFVDGERHGIERLWRNKRVVFEEMRFRQGRQHGVERRWNDKGHLCSGYPRYFVNGDQVPRRAYQSALRTDPTLPIIDPRDDVPSVRSPCLCQGEEQRGRSTADARLTHFVHGRDWC